MKDWFRRFPGENPLTSWLLITTNLVGWAWTVWSCRH